MLENRWVERERKALDRFSDNDRMKLIEELEDRKDKMIPDNTGGNVLEPIANVFVDAIEGAVILIKYLIKSEKK